ncbi:hypothetical protein V8C34DRAFT_277419 [Trichoderma compactum]
METLPHLPSRPPIGRYPRLTPPWHHDTGAHLLTRMTDVVSRFARRPKACLVGTPVLRRSLVIACLLWAERRHQTGFISLSISLALPPFIPFPSPFARHRIEKAICLAVAFAVAFFGLLLVRIVYPHRLCPDNLIPSCCRGK